MAQERETFRLVVCQHSLEGVAPEPHAQVPRDSEGRDVVTLLCIIRGKTSEGRDINIIRERERLYIIRLSVT